MAPEALEGLLFGRGEAFGGLLKLEDSIHSESIYGSGGNRGKQRTRAVNVLGCEVHKAS